MESLKFLKRLGGKNEGNLLVSGLRAWELRVEGSSPEAACGSQQRKTKRTRKIIPKRPNASAFITAMHNFRTALAIE